MNEQLSINFDACRKERDKGIQRAIDHAGGRWAEKALSVMGVFCHRNPGREFLSEDLIEWSQIISPPLESPPHLRAWGGIFQKAARMGLIEKVGIVPSPTPSNHMANKSKWRVK